ncbi:MAG: acyltransferase family protein [Acidimicrobiales bacterium]|nr:acyltransferase family protein [Acidimicrobiales bacterium]
MSAPDGGRRGAIDLARVLALLVVVLGHLTLAVVDTDDDGAVRAANLLELRPSWAWVAVVAPMPVFFAAGGWANATASLPGAVPRLRTLTGLAATVVAAWSALVVLADLVAGDPGIVADGARVATQPLWFLAAYLPLAAAGRWVATSLAARLVPVLAVGLGALAAVDLVRFGLGGPDWPGWVGFPVAWGVPWVLGAWWRRRHEGDGIDERRTGLVLLLGGGAAAVVLVVTAGYEAALIDTGGSARSNTTPPTLYTAMVGVAQTGLLLLVARPLDRVARRFARPLTSAGELAVGVYVWHLSALALVVGAVSLGVSLPDRLSPTWWTIRPLWWLAVLGVTAGLVAATEVVRRRGRTPGRGSTGRSVGVARAGVWAGAAGAALVGLEGPRTAGMAVACTATLAVAWILLGGAGRAGVR